MSRSRRLSFAVAAIAISAAAYLAAPAVAALTEPYPTADATLKVMLPSGHGSGIHIGQGFVVTAAHVVGAEQSVQLKARSGHSRPAEILWINKAYDIALLRTSPAGLASGKLDCRTAKTGESVEAVGNPLAVEFVSAFGKIAGSPRKFAHWQSVFVTDITTVRGQSGGPVFSAEGKVIGITVGIMNDVNGFTTSPMGFGFVVPSSDVCVLLGRSA